MSESEKDLQTKMEEYRGSKRWEGLLPIQEGHRVWDEGFRSFLVKYGMINHIANDVFVSGRDDMKDQYGLSGTSRFKNDLDAFTKEGLKFRYKNLQGEMKQEYDFTNDYHVISNLVGSPRSFNSVEDNWSGFVLLSNDLKEMVVVFRATETTMEWVENASVNLELLHGAKKHSDVRLIRNWQNLMCHAGFHQLYIQKSLSNAPSPKDTIHQLIRDNKETLEAITLVGHSLGGGVAQVCAVELAHSKVAGDVPILAIAWGAPKVGNRRMANWADDHPNLRILRIRINNDAIANLPPDWLWSIFSGGYKHMGTEVVLDQKHLYEAGVVKEGEVSPNHNLQVHLHNIDPTRDVALMNKVGDVIPYAYCIKHHISPSWHSLTWPRTIYHT